MSAETLLLLTVLAHRVHSRFFTANALYKLLTYLLTSCGIAQHILEMFFQSIVAPFQNFWGTSQLLGVCDPLQCILVKKSKILISSEGSHMVSYQ